MSGVIPFNCPTSTALLTFGEPLGRSPGLKSYQHSRDLGTWHRDNPAAQGRPSQELLHPVLCHWTPLLCFAELSEVQSMLWLPGAHPRAGSWVLQQEHSDVTAMKHRATWAALHLSHGARLSTSVPTWMVLTHPSVPAIPQRRLLHSCLCKMLPLWSVFFVTPVFPGVG